MRIFLSLLLLLLVIAPCSANDKRIVAYYTEWSIYGRKFDVSQIPADKLTHVIYAFAKIDARGDVAVVDSYAAIDKFYAGDKWDQGYLRGNFRQLQIGLTQLESVGGDRQGG